MRLLALAVAATSLLGATSAQALELNVSLAGQYWNASPSGEIQGLSTEDPIALKDSLGLSSEGATALSLQIDHFLPVLPNLRLSQTQLDLTGQRTASFRFNNTEFSGQLNNRVDLSHTDVTAYYRLLDGVTSFLPLVTARLELGVTLRLFDGEFTVEGSNSNGEQARESISLSAPVPMGYLGGRLDLPLNLSVGGQVNAIGYSGNSLSDMSAYLRYQYNALPLIKPGVELGYRRMSLELDDLDDTYGDLTLSGPYVGAYLRAGF